MNKIILQAYEFFNQKRNNVYLKANMKIMKKTYLVFNFIFFKISLFVETINAVIKKNVNLYILLCQTSKTITYES